MLPQWCLMRTPRLVLLSCAVYWCLQLKDQPMFRYRVLVRLSLAHLELRETALALSTGDAAMRTRAHDYAGEKTWLCAASRSRPAAFSASPLSRIFTPTA